MNTIHALSDVQSKNIGKNSHIWQFCVVLPNARIGDDCNICSHCFIENDVTIGDRVTIKCGVQIWDGIHIEDDVFIGPNVTFTNDTHPRSKQFLSSYPKTTIQQGASIGANSTILPGITIGKNALVGAGSVVTKDVPQNAIVMGVPAKITSYTDTQRHHTLAINTEQKKTYNGPVLYSLIGTSDIRGHLAAGEFPKQVPFQPKRIFMVYNVPSDKIRGERAHKICHQFLIAVSGSINIIIDDAQTREEFTLSTPDMGLYIKPGTWGIQYKYSKDAVLVALASHEYDTTDYIRNYNDFIEWKKSQ